MQFSTTVHLSVCDIRSTWPACQFLRLFFFTCASVWCCCPTLYADDDLGVFLELFHGKSFKMIKASSLAGCASSRRGNFKDLRLEKVEGKGGRLIWTGAEGDRGKYKDLTWHIMGVQKEQLSQHKSKWKVFCDTGPRDLVFDPTLESTCLGNGFAEISEIMERPRDAEFEIICDDVSGKCTDPHATFFYRDARTRRLSTTRDVYISRPFRLGGWRDWGNGEWQDDKCLKLWFPGNHYAEERAAIGFLVEDSGIR